MCNGLTSIAQRLIKSAVESYAIALIKNRLRLPRFHERQRTFWPRWTALADIALRPLLSFDALRTGIASVASGARISFGARGTALAADAPLTFADRQLQCRNTALDLLDHMP